jgi:hypothetical protein
MSNKNTLLGGSDWVDGSILYAADLNDTFDAAIGFRYIDSIVAVDSTSPTGIITIPANKIINGVKISFDYDLYVSNVTGDGYTGATINILADTNATPSTTKRTVYPKIYGPGSNIAFWPRAVGTITTLIEDLTTTSINYIMISWTLDNNDCTGTLSISNIIVEVY